jgi:hypothetical protein
VETEGIQDVRLTDMDTRFEDSAVLPLATTALGGATLLDARPVYIEWLGKAAATLLAWSPYAVAAFNVARYDGSAWHTVTDSIGGDITGVSGFARYGGAFYLTADQGTGDCLYRSTDGVTWTITGPVGDLRGCCVHDNQFYAYNAATDELWWTQDPTALAGPDWAMSAEPLFLHPEEAVIQLAQWHDGGNPRSNLVMILTTQRLIQFDHTALTFTELDDFSGEIFTTGGDLVPHMTRWKNDDNLYVNFHDRAAANQNADTIMQYTRGQKGTIAPNKLGGLPAEWQVSITHTVGGLNYLFAFGAAPYGSANTGQVFAWDGAGWHPLHTPTDDAESVVGGGYARGQLYTARDDGMVVSQPYGDNRTRPEFRTDTYETGVTRTLRWARTTGGTDLLQKAELWLTVVSRARGNSDDAPSERTLIFGLEGGCEVDAYRRLDGGAWELVGTATSAQVFPWRVDLPAKGHWYECEVRLDARTSDGANTPILGRPQLHFDRTPPDVRDVHDFVIDLAQTISQFGRTAAAIRAELRAMRGQPVTLAYGAGAWGDGPNGTDVACGIFQYAAEEDPLRGVGAYRCEVRDYSTPDDG